jgi:hypothetical protein
MKNFAPITISVLTIFVVVTGTFIGFANADENVFCGDDAATLLGDVCVDSQGRIPDNADIRGAIVDRCNSASHFVNAERSVVGFYNAFYDEYGFCTRLVADDGNVIYYLKFGYDNSRLYRYNITTESWGRLNVWEYSTQNRYLRGRLVTFTERGRALFTANEQDIETRNMYQNLTALLAIQNVNPVVLQDIQRSSTGSY